MVTHLITHERFEAYLIDTTGFFSPLRIRDLVMSRLVSSRKESFVEDGYVYHKAPSEALPDLEKLREAVTKALNRIQVMRVVDLIGVIEAIHEIGETCEKGLVHPAARHKPTERLQKISAEISSSQDDEGEGEDERTHDSIDTSTEHQTSHQPQTGQSYMLLIDNIANHASAELSNNQIGGQALLTTCMRSLRWVTKRHNLCTIVINSVVGTHLHDGPRTPYSIPEQVSIFTSVYGKPALGKTFAHLIDTSLLISKIPASKADAERATNEKSDRQKGSWRSLLVMEVLYDRHGGREGRWGAFDIKDGLELVSGYP